MPDATTAAATRREPVERFVTLPAADGVQGPQRLSLCYFEWGQPRADEPTYLLCHATGFHARCWDETIRRLDAGAHVIAVDLRGHGRSDKTPPYHWAAFGNDIVALIETLDLRNLIGVGHSMGGHVITQAAARLSERFTRLVLVDAVILDPDNYHLASAHGMSEPTEHPASRRKADFADWEEMRARFADRKPFSYWQPEVLTDYCRYGVVPAAAGGVTLGCPPEVEATVYIGTTGNNIQHLLPQISQPVTVLRAKRREAQAGAMDFAASPTWPGLAAALPNGVDVYLPELTHFIIMQAPALVARCLTGAVSGRDELLPLLPAAQ